MKVLPFTFQPLIPDSESYKPKNGAQHYVANHAPKPVEPEAEAPPPPPPPPSFSEEELEAAKQAAFAEGVEAGKAEFAAAMDVETQQIQQAALKISEQIHQQLPALKTQQQDYIDARHSELGSLVLNCAGRIALEALRKDPFSDIEIMVRECMETLMGNPEIMITVHPKLQASIKEAFGREVKLKTDNALSPGDCRIHWDRGEAVREIDRIWTDIESVIERHFGKAIIPERADEASDPLASLGVKTDLPQEPKTVNSDDALEPFDSADLASESAIEPELDDAVAEAEIKPIEEDEIDSQISAAASAVEQEVKNLAAAFEEDSNGNRLSDDEIEGDIFDGTLAIDAATNDATTNHEPVKKKGV